MPSYPIGKIIDIIEKLELDVDIIYISTDIPIQNKDDIPDHAGIYILKDRSGNRYIGCCKNILKRQKNHHIRDVNTIDVFLIENDDIAKKLESVLIYILDPELNRYRKCHSWLRIANDSEQERTNYIKKIFKYKDHLSEWDRDRFNFEKYSIYRKIEELEKDKLADNYMSRNIQIKDDLYKELNLMKDKGIGLISFSDVIENIIKKSEETEKIKKELSEKSEELERIKRDVSRWM